MTIVSHVRQELQRAYTDWFTDPGVTGEPLPWVEEVVRGWERVFGRPADYLEVQEMPFTSLVRILATWDD